ncbi:MAG TPA: FAD-dependent oxidoreductase [Gemmataceae bacterium]|nr:FAD-dependent oxidoreductase [Gemmataceae bacterium]
MSDQPLPPRPAHGQSFDVAVVGGGISGVYTAWKLRTTPLDQLSPELRARAEKAGRLAVGLFEAGGRIGGRLFSRAFPVSGELPPDDPAVPSVPDTVVELGGMRYLDPDHRRVVALVKEFKLTPAELPTADERGTNLYYLRGRHFTAADWSRPEFIPPYQLDRAERVRSPGSLMIEVALRHEPRWRADPAAYRRIGFWNLLYDELSSEAYQLVRDAGGYETIVGNWSAADAIPFLLADFKPGQKYLKLREGFMGLPVAIRNVFEKAGGTVWTRHRLHQIKVADKGGLRLSFDFNNPAEFERPRRVGCEPVDVTAAHVVLAMPRRSIELLHPDSVVFDETEEGREFQKALRSVVPQAGFKIFAAYKSPWWRDARNIHAGRSLTDLPVRQCYAWRTATRADPSQVSVLMASYNDGASVEFWKGLARRPGAYVPPPEAYPPGVAIPTTDPEGIVAPDALVAELHDQLRELHGVTDVAAPDIQSILRPYFAVFKDWTADPFGGGWHFWDIGIDSTVVRRRMRKPFAGLPLHVCGEAWSSQQGWVEGALEAADEVLSFFLADA